MAGNRPQIRKIAVDINVSDFDCGDEDLNDFLKNDALPNQCDWFSVTKVLLIDNIAAGFFTITPDTLHKGRIALSNKIQTYPYQKYPAVKLARLAVDRKFQHQGFGDLLMDSFFETARDAITVNGGRFVTVDAKNTARSFYERYMFRVVPSQKDLEIISM